MPGFEKLLLLLGWEFGCTNGVQRAGELPDRGIGESGNGLLG